MTTADLPELPLTAGAFELVYSGVLPKSARDPVLALLVEGAREGFLDLSSKSDLGCFVGFGSSNINIGDISTGPVKAVIDGLYPILGGSPGAPWDYRIQDLTLAKGIASVGATEVRIRIWRLGATVEPTAIVKRETPQVQARAARIDQEGAVAVSQVDAIWEAYAALGGTRTVREIQDYVNGKYPSRWKDLSTTMADLVYKGNSSSTYKERQQFLERVGRGQYRVRAGASKP